eukprot:358565-Chlamydomonas_euryale.AAC.1
MGWLAQCAERQAPSGKAVQRKLSGIRMPGAPPSKAALAACTCGTDSYCCACACASNSAARPQADSC